jgi:hypothetical protein
MFLDTLYDNATSCPEEPVFKLLESLSVRDEDLRWREVSYGQFHEDVERTAKYWHTVFYEQMELSSRDVIGIW